MKINVMMVLGLFVFMLKTVPYQNKSRSMSWSHASNDVIGGMPKFQFTGKAGETITLKGVLMPEITGGALSLKALELMAEMGLAYPLIDGGDFGLVGHFVITELSEDFSEFFPDGSARRIEFTLTLERVDDSLLSQIGALGAQFF